MESEIGPEDADAPSSPAEPGSEGSDGNAFTQAESGSDGNAFAPVESAPPTLTAQTVQSDTQLPPAPPIPPGPAYGYGQQPMPPGAPYGPHQPYGAYGYPPQGYPPTGYPPAGYPPYGYGGLPPRRGLDGTAVASLVLGICGFLLVTPVIGLILGIVALSTIKRTGRRGRGQAITGIVLSSVWVTVFAVLITAAVLLVPDPPRRDADGTVVKAGTIPIFNLHPKDCFTVPAGLTGSKDSNTRTLKVVPCATPHDAEEFGSFESTDDSYPGLSAMRSEALTQCLQILASYLPDPASLPARTRVDFFFGNQQTWDDGQHKVECFVHFPSPTVTESVARSEADYSQDQLQFLQAVQPVASALTRLDETPDSVGLDVLQKRATDVANAMQTETSDLTAATWPSQVQTMIDDLAAQDRVVGQLWAQAAGTSDIASFLDVVRRAYNAYDAQPISAIRSALGLTGIAGGGSGDSGDGSGSGSGSQAA